MRHRYLGHQREVRLGGIVDRPNLLNVLLWSGRIATRGESQPRLHRLSPTGGSAMAAVSLGPSRRCFRDALDQAQSCQHEHLFRLGLDAKEVALLEFP